MSRAIYVYLAIMLVMLSVVTGIPFKILPDLPERGQSLPVAEVASKAAVDPEPIGLPAAEASTTAQALLPTSLAHAPMVRGGEEGLEPTTSAILRALAVLPPAPQDDLRAMSEQALAGLRAQRGGASTAQTLEAIVAQGLKAGQSDAAIDGLVNDAARRSDISVPAALVTVEGRVDTAVLLANLVSRAKQGGAVSTPAPMAKVTRYEVKAGDSLGAIALRVYGDAAYYQGIFDANKGLLFSPDKLSVGLELVIPAQGRM